jgi:hemolysin III
MSSLYRLFRDPVSGLTHLAGALFGLVGVVYLLAVSQAKDSRTLAAIGVYGVSMVLLYLSSSTYHLVRARDAVRVRLRQLDHSMVPIFIAGTYTPFCEIALKGTTGTVILSIIWALALGGLLKAIYWVHAPRWLTAGLFVLMGWVIVLAVYPLYQSVTGQVFALVVAGGVAYTVGALIYAMKWPDPWPPHFGFHEIWHLFVLIGSALHYAAVLALLA